MEKDQCIICLEEITETSSEQYDSCAILQECTCLYTAHIECIAEWVSKNHSCPICHKWCTIGYRQSNNKRFINFKWLDK